MVRVGLNIVFICHAFHFKQRVASIPTSCLDISAYWCVCVSSGLSSRALSLQCLRFV